jgi:hypothetical protein
LGISPTLTVFRAALTPRRSRAGRAAHRGAGWPIRDSSPRPLRRNGTIRPGKRTFAANASHPRPIGEGGVSPRSLAPMRTRRGADGRCKRHLVSLPSTASLGQLVRLAISNGYRTALSRSQIHNRLRPLRRPIPGGSTTS